MAPLMLQRLSQIVKIAFWLPIKVIPWLLATFVKTPPNLVFKMGLHAWDAALFLGNLLTPQLSQSSVVKPSKPGYKGLWPPFIEPTETDSRAPCPGLNAMANHGILPHDGRNITMDILHRALVDTFNFSTTLTKDTTDSIEGLFGRKTIDLGDLCAHNIVEHDASFLRRDAYFEPDQRKPAKDLILSLLRSASGPITPEHPEGSVTPDDLGRFFSVRLAQSKQDNRVFSLSLAHKFFAVSNASLLYEVSGGDVAICRTLLIEERFPEGYQTRMRGRFGYTMIDFHMRSLEISLGVTGL